MSLTRDDWKDIADRLIKIFIVVLVCSTAYSAVDNFSSALVDAAHAFADGLGRK